MVKACLRCRTEYEPTGTYQKFCSVSCRNRFRWEAFVKRASAAEIDAHFAEVRRVSGKYASREAYNAYSRAYQKGWRQRMTEEQRARHAEQKAAYAARKRAKARMPGTVAA